MGTIPDTRPAIERLGDRIPLVLSYFILGASWFTFFSVVSIHQVLFQRNDLPRFLIHFILVNALWGSCIASLFVASSRNPGYPNPDLAPSRNEQSRPPTEEKRRPAPIILTASPVRARASAGDDDDIPLRFLRNAKWVSTRSGKDRPSPLPLFHNRNQSRGNPSAGEGSSSSSSGHEYNNSPFPLSANPFVPDTANEAGEDTDEEAFERRRARSLEGVHEADEGPGQGDLEQLLPRNDRTDSSDKGARWCKRCDAWKPDRAHHCRYCRQCTLKMDHHCVWLSTCVGFHNYKPFLLFITYGTLISLFVMIEAGREAIRFFNNPEEFISSTPQPHSNQTCTVDSCDPGYNTNVETFDLAPVVTMALAIVGFVFFLAIGSLTAYHWWLASNNLTTLENISVSYPSVIHEDAANDATADPNRIPLSRSERNMIRRESRDINVYDLGITANLRSIFGRHALLLAFVPFVRAYRKSDIQAGHFFDLDQDKLERLRVLTRKLREDEGAAQAEVFLEDDSETEDETEGDDEGREMPYNLDDPNTATSGGQGDDEMSQDGTERRVAWYDHRH